MVALRAAHCTRNSDAQGAEHRCDRVSHFSGDSEGCLGQDDLVDHVDDSV